jgi:hypothetical protein
MAWDRLLIFGYRTSEVSPLVAGLCGCYNAQQ